MRIAFAAVLAVHALIHILGFAKAFELARVAQLTIFISRTAGLVWLGAAIVLLASALSLFAAPKWFWLLACVGVGASQLAIFTSWHDARFGTIVNLVTLVVAAYAAVAWGPFGLRAEYEERISRRMAQLVESPPVTEAELAPLPLPVQRYLRYVGVVGQPHVRALRNHFTGRIRSGPDAPWMPFTGEQHNFLDPPARYFAMKATMRGLPVDVLHTYDESGARMQVKVLSMFPMVDASGIAFTKAETVTVFNDLCIMAPATLVDPAIHWKQLDAQSVEATYTNGPHTIRAVLNFDEAGALVYFWSDDRPSLAPDGVTFVPQRWSTPVGDYRPQGPFRLASRGEGQYAAPSGEYAYIEFDNLKVSYDL